jgi:HlyD family secretion protein
MALERKRRILPAATLLLVLSAVGAAIFYLRPEDAPAEVDAVRITRGEVRETVTAAASGDVKPVRRVIVRAELAGTVRELRGKKGERVAAGELIVLFSSDEIDARLDQAKANVDAARVSIKIAETRLETARRALARAKKLRASDAISEVDLDRAETDVKTLEDGLDQAKAAEKQARAAEEIARVARNHASVKAPFAGVLQDVFAEIGVQMAPGQALFDLIDDSGVRIDVPVDESDVSRIFVGQRVTLKSDSARGVPLFGAVALIPPAVGKPGEGGGIEGAAAGALASKDRSLYVVVTPDDPKMLRIGSSVGAEFLVRAREGVLFVPSNAVLGRGATRTVFRVEGGVARKAQFQAGLTSWERTEIVSGLSEKEVVLATLNVRDLDDGVQVRVRRVIDPPALADPRPDRAASPLSRGPGEGGAQDASEAARPEPAP